MDEFCTTVASGRLNGHTYVQLSSWKIVKIGSDQEMAQSEKIPIQKI